MLFGTALSNTSSVGNRYSASAASTCAPVKISGISASSSYAGFAASHAIDGSLRTRWAAAPGSWIMANLQSKQIICSVSVAWFRGDSVKYSFEIQLSIDGSSWSQAYAGTSSGKTKALESYSIPSMSAQAIKILVSGSSTNKSVSITELAVGSYASVSATPSIEITSPAQLSTVSSPILNVTGSASDGTGAGIESVEVRVDNGPFAAARQLGSNGWGSWSAPTNLGAAGPHNVTAMVVDLAGNQASNTVAVTVQSGLYDDFSGGTYTLVDGQSSPNGKWHDQFNGYGSAGVRADSNSNNIFFEQPETATDGSTHAALVLSTKNLVTSYKLSLDVRTDRQLKPNPNTWETAWIMFNYVDSWHHYYFTLKTNGYELGKKDNNLQQDQQVFLATGASPSVTLGTWQHVDIQVQGNHIIVWVNSAKVADYFDTGMSSAFANGGALGLYTEDSAVSFDNIYTSSLQ